MTVTRAEATGGAGSEMALLWSLQPAAPATATDIVAALGVLADEVQALREAVQTPERRLAALGLVHAAALPGANTGRR